MSDSKKANWEIDKQYMAFRRNGKLVTLSDLLEMLNAAEEAVWVENHTPETPKTRNGFTVGDVYEFRKSSQYEVVGFSQQGRVDLRCTETNEIYFYPETMLSLDVWEKVS